VRRRPLAALLLFAAAGLVSVPSGAERIRHFGVDVQLDAEGHYFVEERIVYDFESAQRHGIYRDIPVRYQRSIGSYHLKLDAIQVTDAAGDVLQSKTTRRGGNVRIRIGDPKQTVTGVHEYRIVYRVRRGMLFFEGHDELYWNATGNAWKVPVDAATATVSLPPGSAAATRSACFTGPQGSLESACGSEEQDGSVSFASRRALGQREGLTLVLAIPKGALHEPSAWARALDRASDWLGWPTLLPLGALAAMALAWSRLGRDPPGPVRSPCATSRRRA